MVEIRWEVPANVSTTDFNKTRILRATMESGPYLPVDEIDTLDSDGNVRFRYEDADGNRNFYYQIRYFNSTSKLEFHDFSITIFPLSPREKRLITFILGWVPDILKPDLTEFEMQFALRLSMNAFNVQPPETMLTLDNFPDNYEHFLITGAEVNLTYHKFLKLAIRDFSYSDMGFSLNIDRGSKMRQFAEDSLKQYNEYLKLAKFNFTHMGLGLGTVPLPLSMGGQISRNLLNVLDIMTALGR